MTTNDELQAARDEYADAQESLSVEPGTEFGQIVVLGNALDAAGELITALEAHAAAQQQRINELTAALEPFAQRFERDNMDIAGDDSDPMYRFVMNTGELLPGTPVIERKEFRRAHEALRGKGA